MIRSYHYEAKRVDTPLERTYERFLELPPALVISVLWLAGLMFVCLCVLVLYVFVSQLAGV